ncbi:NADP-dependent oxidoreductase [Candidatus Pelagibacter sp.]|nr:NADP-dependent oxidoreductase [Candidatus Pelagibacter sp.]
MTIISKYVALKNYIPTGLPKETDFEIKSKEISINKEKNILVSNSWISVDPYMRARMTERKNYKPPFKIGEEMEGYAIGKVEISNDKSFNVGDLVFSSQGMRDNFVCSADKLKKLKAIDMPIQSYLGPLGMTGHTAYIGLLKHGELKAGQTVLVSSAGGSVGSTVCQIAKNLGCKVIASTGSDEKVDWLKNELKVDYAFNYKKVENLVLHFKEVCPDGFDLYFDNVGGDFLESAIFQMKNFGRIVVCGRISQMNVTTPGSGIKNMAHVLVKRLTIKGFLIFDHENEREPFETDMLKWLSKGEIKFKETIYTGIESAPKSFIDLLKGKNTGKMLVKI